MHLSIWIINEGRGGGPGWPKEFRQRQFFLSKYPSSHELVLSDSHPKRSIPLYLCQKESLLLESPLSWFGYQLTKTVQNGGLQAISEFLHIEYRIVSCIETYLIHIYHMSKCSKCNWNRYIEGFCMWNAHFHMNGLSPNTTYVILMNWPLMAIYFLLLNYWLFSVQFSYQI